MSEIILSDQEKFVSDTSRQVEFMRAIRGGLEERLAPMKVAVHYLDLIEEPSKIQTFGLKAYAIKGTMEHTETKRSIQIVCRFRATIGDTEKEDVEALVEDVVTQIEGTFYPESKGAAC